MKRAVFLDRDGVLVAVNELVHGPLTLDDFRLLEGIEEPLRRLRAAGFLLVLATNQPGISRGSLRQDVLDHMHEALQAAVPLDALYVCPHTQADRCGCRKPQPGLLREAARDLGIDLRASFFIGDTATDMQAGEAAGVTFLLLDAPYNRDLGAANRVPSLAHAADLILRS